MKNQAHLIAYADRLGGTLPGLLELIEGPFAGLFGGIHLLPFFDPIDGADAGFDPIDHARVDERLGSWDDVAALARTSDIMADVIVNHISSGSPQFIDLKAKGDRSSYAGMFLTFDRVFPKGATEADLLAIYRPRPGLPFTSIRLATGSPRLFWTTFTADQIDIDVSHPLGRDYLENILRVFARNGIAQIRLDAVGYAVKQAGTTCFMIDDTFDFIGRFSETAQRHGLEVLVEVHSHFQRQIEIARHVSWVYDFALPPLVLHAFFSGTGRYLKEWIRVRPTNAVNVLDTHDGIGIIDVGADAQGHEGLVPNGELGRLVEQIHVNSQGQSRSATGTAADNLDLYQVNCTFYDALARDDLRYLLCRAIQLFLPGVPQIYYVGLLAGTNDAELLAATRVGRDINRHYYTRAEIDLELRRPVVTRLFELIRLRNSHPAFDGEFELAQSSDRVVDLRWRNGADFARLELDLRTLAYRLEHSSAGLTTRLVLASRLGIRSGRRSQRSHDRR